MSGHSKMRWLGLRPQHGPHNGQCIACVADDIGHIDNIGYFGIVGNIGDNIGDIGNIDIGHIGDIFGAMAWKMEVKSLYLMKNLNFQSSKI